MGRAALLLLLAAAAAATQCGLRGKRVPFVRGGSVSFAGYWPWVASLADRYGAGAHFCGAALISERALLTAAHCFYRVEANQRVKKEAKDIVAVVGEYDLNSPDNTEQKIYIRRVYIHPQFNTLDPSEFDHDLAIVELIKPVWRNTTPVCLPEPNESQPEAGTKCVILGWGLDQDNMATRRLHHTIVPVVGARDCRDHWIGYELKPTNLCAGKASEATDVSETRGPCQGDSGGPLLCETGRNGAWTVVGTVSWGSLICMRKPAVFVDVAQHRRWVSAVLYRMRKASPKKPRPPSFPTTKVSEKRRQEARKRRPYRRATAHVCDPNKFRVHPRMRIKSREVLARVRKSSYVSCQTLCCKIKRCQSAQFERRKSRSVCTLLKKKDCNISPRNRIYPTRQSDKWYYVSRQCDRYTF